jgi:hypothetical protein
MVRTASEKQHRPAEPLLTRHVFLDTQVYRALGHSPTNPALLTLKEQIEAHCVVLHTTDITLLEVRRQIHERVQTHRRELASIEKDFRRWREQAPKSTPKRLLEFDAEALSTELFERFRMFLLVECQSEVHQALVAPEVIFAKYFDRKPPFDGENSKEFPGIAGHQPHPVGLGPEPFGDDLCKARLVALARRHRPQYQLDGARRIDRQLGPLARRAGVELDRHRDADPAAAAAPARLRPARREPRPVPQFGRPPQRGRVIAAVIDEAERIAVRHRFRRHEVAPPRRGTATDAGSTTWLSTPVASNRR